MYPTERAGPAHILSSHRRRRRGIAAVIAMLFLIIFSALAVGFFAAVTMAAQVAHNDERALGAQLAAESGLKFIQFQLSQVSVPGDTPEDKVIDEVLKDLVAQQAGSENFAGKSIVLSGKTIHYPAGASNFIDLDISGAGFHAEITDATGGFLLVKVHGRYRGMLITRACELMFESVPRSSQVFDFGIVTRGPIRITGGGSIVGPANPQHATVLSLSPSSTPLTMTGSATIAGDVFMTNANGSASISGNVSIGGSSMPSLRDEHIHIGSPNPEPELPAVDTNIFLPYVTSTYKPGRKAYTNVLVPAGTNPNFGSDVTIEGVMYIKHPNNVKFTGHATIRGTIVVENGASAAQSNSITFSGGATNYGMETLPDSPAFPPALKALRGSALLAPGFDVTLTGHSGSIGGTMVADSFKLTGGSGGVIDGTLIGLGSGELTLTGGAQIARTKPNGPIPAGLIFSKTYAPIPESYTEVKP